MASPDVLDWTPEQITEAIANAIKLREFDAVVALLKLLAVKDPDLAQQTLDTINAGILIGGAAHGD